MSKCSVWRVLKSKASHWTLLRPKYCAWSGTLSARRTRTVRERRAALRIDAPRGLVNVKTAVRCKLFAPAKSRNGEHLGVRWRQPPLLDRKAAAFAAALLHVQHLERVRPRPRADAVQHPGQAHRLEIARAFDAADVDHA